MTSVFLMLIVSPKLSHASEKITHADLHLGVGISIEGAVIGKQEISQYCFLNLCDGLKSS